MIDLLNLFLNNIAPIFLAAGAGLLLARHFGLQPRLLSLVTFYVFSPCLLFYSLTSSQLGGAALLQMLGFALAVILATGGLAWLAGRLLHLERRMLVAVMLTTMFMNAGNYGLPLVDFAFGEKALAYAVVYFACMVIVSNTFGVLVASLGSVSLWEALRNLFKTPPVYAVLLALLFSSFGWSLPLPVERTVAMMSDATIPCMLVLLGMQLHTARLDGQVKPLLLAVGLRNVVAPLLAMGLAALWGLSGPARQAAIIQSAMPAAVLTTMLATEYDVEPSFVTYVIFVGTVLSPLTLTPLLAWLGA